MTRIKLPILLAICMLFYTACDNFEKNCYSALRADQAAYEQLVTEISERYSAGVLTEAQFDKCSDLMAKWGAAHNGAVTALEVYHLGSKTQDDKQLVLIAIAYSQQILRDVREILTSFGVIGEDGIA